MQEDAATTSEDYSPALSYRGSLVEFPVTWQNPLSVAYSLKAERNLDDMEPILHKNNPVFSIERSAIDAEQALQSVLACPEKFMSKIVPEMVTENFCFVVDGDKLNLQDVVEDESWWKATGRPTRYYYSDDMKNFLRVDIVLVKGSVVSARLHGRGRTAAAQGKPTQDGSGSGTGKVPADSRKEVTVSLDKVFKVSRFYSYWRSCTGFHRIISVISPVKEGVVDFRRRIFVQYLWRKAKEADKAKVTLEYDPKNKQLTHQLGVPRSKSNQKISPTSPNRRQTLF